MLLRKQFTYEMMQGLNLASFLVYVFILCHVYIFFSSLAEHFHLPYKGTNKINEFPRESTE